MCILLLRVGLLAGWKAPYSMLWELTIYFSHTCIAQALSVNRNSTINWSLAGQAQNSTEAENQKIGSAEKKERKNCDRQTALAPSFDDENCSLWRRPARSVTCVMCLRWNAELVSSRKNIIAADYNGWSFRLKISREALQTEKELIKSAMANYYDHATRNVINPRDHLQRPSTSLKNWFTDMLPCFIYVVEEGTSLTAKKWHILIFSRCCLHAPFTTKTMTMPAIRTQDMTWTMQLLSFDVEESFKPFLNVN